MKNRSMLFILMLTEKLHWLQQPRIKNMSCAKTDAKVVSFVIVTLKSYSVGKKIPSQTDIYYKYGTEVLLSKTANFLKNVGYGLH